jgi:hypothetical protein
VIHFIKFIHFIIILSGLPQALQPLGNNYARDEFKRHKKCTEPEAQLFMHEWTVLHKDFQKIISSSFNIHFFFFLLQKYALNLAQQLGLRGKSEAPIGQHLNETYLESFRDEQVAQLYELLLAAKEMDENDRKILDKVDK